MPKLSGNVQYQHFIDIPTSIIPAGSFFAGDEDLMIPPNPAEDLEVQFGVKNNLTGRVYRQTCCFLMGSFFVGLQAAKLFKEMVAQQTEVTKDELVVNVAKAYLGVLLAKKNADLVRDNISNLQKTLDETEKIYQEGFIEKLDVDRLELSLNNLRIEEEKVGSLIALSKNVLKFSMGFPLTDTIEVRESLEELMINDYTQMSLNNVEPTLSNRADYTALQTADELNELNIKRLKFQYLPVLRGFGSYSQVLQGNDLGGGSWFPTTVVGLTLQVPIFDGFEKSSKIDRAKIDRDQHLLTINEVEQAIALEVENAKLSYRNALRSVNAAEYSEALAQDIYDTAMIKYREGVGSSIETTQAEGELYRAQGNYINALYELLSAKIDLEQALGTLRK